MNVIVGSENPVKVRAVRQALRVCDFFVDVAGVSVPSGIDAQPFGLEMIVNGSHNRAMAAYFQGLNDGEGDVVGVGVESGIFELYHGVFFDVCHVTLYDGRCFYDGLSSGFEVPSKIVSCLKNEGKELCAFYDGKGVGAIGVLTDGVVTREEQVLHAATLAVARYVNREKYE